MLASFFDLPSVDIYLSGNQHSKAVSVYGVNRYQKHLELSIDEESEGPIPKEFNRVFEVLQSISRDGASKYKPEYIRVNLEILVDQSLEAITWPKHWPGLYDKNTIKWNNPEYSIYLPASKKVRKEFIKLYKKISVILLDGKKWGFNISSVSFPYEHIWWEAFK